VPRSLGGVATVPLCHACHGKAHGRARGFRDTNELTSKALADLKASGVRLGGAALGWEHTDKIDAAGRRVIAVVASESASVARIMELRAAGTSLRAIVATMNTEGHVTKTDAKWHLQTVVRAIERTSA
jgi:hypothetical protein